MTIIKFEQYLTSGQITLFGNPHKHKLDSHEQIFFDANSEHVLAYYKFFYGNDVYFSSSYKRATQTDDSVVLLKDGRIGRISLIFKMGTTISLLLKMLAVEKVDQLPEHILRVTKSIIDKFEVVPAENISKKLLFISTTKDSFTSELPNPFEGD